MKLAVVGSRGFTNYQLLCDTLDQYADVTLVVSGGAIGADTLAERWAKEHEIPTQVFLPDWNKFGRRAGLIRNDDIVNAADQVVAFWDGKSTGTQYTINFAEKKQKPVQIVKYE